MVGDAPLMGERPDEGKVQPLQAELARRSDGHVHHYRSQQQRQHRPAAEPVVQPNRQRRGRQQQLVYHGEPEQLGELPAQHRGLNRPAGPGCDRADQGERREEERHRPQQAPTPKHEEGRVRRTGGAPLVHDHGVRIAGRDEEHRHDREDPAQRPPHRPGRPRVDLQASVRDGHHPQQSVEHHHDQHGDDAGEVDQVVAFGHRHIVGATGRLA